jgi:hypothetical protein
MRTSILRRRRTPASGHPIPASATPSSQGRLLAEPPGRMVADLPQERAGRSVLTAASTWPFATPPGRNRPGRSPRSAPKGTVTTTPSRRRSPVVQGRADPPPRPLAHRAPARGGHRLVARLVQQPALFTGRLVTSRPPNTSRTGWKATSHEPSRPPHAAPVLAAVKATPCGHRPAADLDSGCGPPSDNQRRERPPRRDSQHNKISKQGEPSLYKTRAVQGPVDRVGAMQNPSLWLRSAIVPAELSRAQWPNCWKCQRL